MKHLHLIAVALFLCSFSQMAAAELPQDNTKAVILAYYRISEDGYPASNLRLEQFQEHINEITNGDYNVLPVPEILHAIKNQQELPENTIGITFQGGFRSASEHAVPLLKEHNLPYTIFFSSEMAETQNPQYLNWQDLTKLAKQKNVTLGLMPAEYKEISQNSFEENKRLFNKALVQYRKHLKSEPQLFAYPFGEFDQKYKNFIQTQNLQGAFGLQSSPISPSADFSALPRFAMTEQFGDLERFQIVTRTLPLHAYDIHPETSLIEENPAIIGFTLPEELSIVTNTIRCYASDQGEIKPEILGTNRIEIRPEPIPGTRLRINCTSPVYEEGKQETKTYRWLGFLISSKE